jgi:hypothetical protein
LSSLPYRRGSTGSEKRALTDITQRVRSGVGIEVQGAVAPPRKKKKKKNGHLSYFLGKIT